MCYARTDLSISLSLPISACNYNSVNIWLFLFCGCPITGAYYGTGRGYRAGTLSHFLLGIIAPGKFTKGMDVEIYIYAQSFFLFLFSFSSSSFSLSFSVPPF